MKRRLGGVSRVGEGLDHFVEVVEQSYIMIFSRFQIAIFIDNLVRRLAHPASHEA